MVAQHAGDQADGRLDQRHGGDLAPRQHEIAQRDLLDLSRFDNIKEMYAATDKMLKALTDPARPIASPRARDLLTEARHLLETVRLDGSWGVHNPRYTEQLILRAKGKVLEAEKLVAPTPTTAPATRGE